MKVKKQCFKSLKKKNIKESKKIEKRSKKVFEKSKEIEIKTQINSNKILKSD